MSGFVNPNLGSLRDELMRGRRLRAIHWIAVGSVLVATLAAWQGSHHPGVIPVGLLFGVLLLGSFQMTSRVNRRALRYADLVSAELRFKNEMLAYAREVAQEANRAKDRFLVSMNHDLRTPLNAVIGLTEAMLRGELGRAERGHAEVVLDAAERLLATIEDMLDLARVEDSKLCFESVAFDLHLAVAGACDVFAARASDKGIALKRKIDPSLERHRVRDPGRVRQVILNLVRNAIEFTDQGSVQICAAGVPDGGSELVRFEVRDTGAGIEPERRRRLFAALDPQAVSATVRGAGTGLGLAISKRLVEQMGGEIGVEDREGGGSVFWFTARLPVCGAGAASEPRAESRPTVSLPARVLLVEDDADNQRVARAMLGQGPEVTVAESGPEACALAARREFDLILMDVQLREMDGLEATREIRAREAKVGGRRTPIIAMTAYADVEDRSACLAAGMDGYVSKPVRREQLLDELARVLDSRVARVAADS